MGPYTYTYHTHFLLFFIYFAFTMVYFMFKWYYIGLYRLSKFILADVFYHKTSEETFGFKNAQNLGNF